jgi:polysaccharide export outer membrane protein
VASKAQDADVMVVGNRITIVFSGIPNPPEAHMEQISSDGHITPPFLDEPVRAAGLTAAELQQKLHKLYVPDIYRKITITVLNSERYFFVGGEVRTPGQKPYLSQMTVVKAIQAAGDFTEFANERAVQVLRTDGRSEIIDVKAALRDPSRDSPVYPGDIINVNRSLIK